MNLDSKRAALRSVWWKVAGEKVAWYKQSLFKGGGWYVV